MNTAGACLAQEVLPHEKTKKPGYKTPVVLNHLIASNAVIGIAGMIDQPQRLETDQMLVDGHFLKPFI